MVRLDLLDPGRRVVDVSILKNWPPKLKSTKDLDNGFSGLLAMKILMSEGPTFPNAHLSKFKTRPQISHARVLSLLQLIHKLT